VRSSATAEDLPEASFAGQHESYLNVRGAPALLDACRRCFASLFTDRAVQYRINHGFDHFDVALSIGVQRMVRADLASSGVVFTLDTESGFTDVVFVTSTWGLGENIVQGAVEPDEFYVHKPTLRRRMVLRRKLGEKKLKMVYAQGGAATRNVPTSVDERERYSISDDEVVRLAELAVAIEAHYSALAGRPTPMDIEWARDGIDGRLYVVQARPETVISQRRGTIMTEYRLRDRGEVATRGRAVGSAVASGPVRVIRDHADLQRFESGAVLVADTTTPDWGTVMREAAALVTNRGGRTCHAAIVARELDIPAVVGCGDATTALSDGEVVTVACCEGEVGRVYRGSLPVERIETDLAKLVRPRTKIMVNLGNPDLAFRTALIPNDGVGLARLEFIITEYVKAHPMALAHPERISDAAVRGQIERLTRGYPTPADFFIERLSEGVATIAAAFYPKPVIVRLSDFKTNEYAKLLGGADFEPAEPNPMIGFRGASRYAHPAYEDGFALECAALLRVRNDMGLDNVKLMIPFCRRVDEARAVLACMARHGLERGRDGLEVYVMCEIPNNVISLAAFAEHFDGFSIGSNDLTQLTLGVDRDSETVAFDFDERDPGVMKMLEMAVLGAQRNHRHCGICGQAPSDYPEVAEFLVRLGIDSLSLNPDSVLATTLRIVDLERSIGSPATGLRQ
jgi:pyruvate, water dikinase